MKKLYAVFAMASIMALASCDQTSHQDNATQNADTMVIKQDRTDSATNSISTDTTKR